MVCLIVAWIVFFCDVPKKPHTSKRKRFFIRKLAEQCCQSLKSWLKAPLAICLLTFAPCVRHLVLCWERFKGTLKTHRVMRQVRQRIRIASKHNHRIRNFKFRKRLFVMGSIAVVHSSTDHLDGSPRMNTFDTDSIDFGVDNRCTACISNMPEHFVGTLTPSKRVIKGFGGARITNVSIGTMRIRIEDDDGKVETFNIPNSHFVPHSEERLLSPQHWCKMMKKSQRPSPGIAAEQTFHDRVVLRWNGSSSIKTIPLDPRTNVATFFIAPSFNCFALHCKDAQINLDEEDVSPLVMDSTALISDNDANEDDDSSDGSDTPHFHVAAPKQTSFDLDGPVSPSMASRPVLVEDEEDRGTLNNVSAEFLRWHHRFNHCSPKRLQLLAK